MITKIDKDGNAFGSPSIIVIKSDGKVKTVGGGGGGGITVGTTPITSGVDGRVLFQSGGVVSQDSGFFWDNTNKRLGVGTSTPSYALHVSGITRINNLLVTDTDTGVSAGEVRLKTFVTGANHVTLKSNGDTRFGKNISVPDLSGIEFNNSTNRIGTNSSTAQLKFDSFGYMVFNNANTYSTGYYDFQIQSVSRLRINTNGNVSIGATTAGARLDVRAQGALSTDIVFRVRNSADTGNLFSIRGDGNAYLDSGGRIYGDSTNPFIALSNALGARIGYGVNRIDIGGAIFTFGTDSIHTLRHRSNSGTRISDGANVTEPASDGLQAVLALQSTTRGFLPPRMTTTQRNAISAPPAGLMVYDTTDNKHYGYNGTNWNALY
jgi:hypothetical protein